MGVCDFASRPAGYAIATSLLITVSTGDNGMTIGIIVDVIVNDINRAAGRDDRIALSRTVMRCATLSSETSSM